MKCIPGEQRVGESDVERQNDPGGHDKKGTDVPLVQYIPEANTNAHEKTNTT